MTNTPTIHILPPHDGADGVTEHKVMINGKEYTVETAPDMIPASMVEMYESMGRPYEVYTNGSD